MAESFAASGQPAATGATGVAAVGYGHSYGHGFGGYSHGPQGVAQYNEASFTGSGAGPNTMWYMMAFVSTAYIALFVMMAFSCLGGPSRRGFIRFDVHPQQDVEARAPVKPEGPVAEPHVGCPLRAGVHAQDPG